MTASSISEDASAGAMNMALSDPPNMSKTPNQIDEQLFGLYFILNRVLKQFEEQVERTHYNQLAWNFRCVEVCSLGEILDIYPRFSIWSVLSFQSPWEGGAALIMNYHLVQKVVHSPPKNTVSNELKASDLSHIDQYNRLFAQAFTANLNKNPLNFMMRTFPHTPSLDEFQNVALDVNLDTSVLTMTFEVLNAQEKIDNVVFILPKLYLQQFSSWLLQTIKYERQRIDPEMAYLHFIHQTLAQHLNENPIESLSWKPHSIQEKYCQEVVGESLNSFWSLVNLNAGIYGGFAILTQKETLKALVSHLEKQSDVQEPLTTYELNQMDILVHHFIQAFTYMLETSSFKFHISDFSIPPSMAMIHSVFPEVANETPVVLFTYRILLSSGVSHQVSLLIPKPYLKPLSTALQMSIANEQDKTINWYEQGLTATDPDRKIECYSQALLLKRNMTDAYVARARAYTEKSDYKNAIVDYHKALSLESDNLNLRQECSAVYQAQGQFYAEKGMSYRALMYYRHAIELIPDNTDIQHSQERVFEKKGAVGSERQKCEEALQWYERGWKTNVLNQKIEAYSRAIALDPLSSELKMVYMEVCLKRADQYYEGLEYDKAIADYHMVISLMPLDREYRGACVKIHARRADAYAQKGMYENAIADYNRVLELNVLSHEKHENVHQALQRLSQKLDDRYQSMNLLEESRKAESPESQVQILTHALVLDTFNIQAYAARGTLFAEHSMLTLALADYNKILSIDPLNHEIYAQREQVYETMRHRREELIRHLKKEVHMDYRYVEFCYFQERVAEMLTVQSHIENGWREWQVKIIKESHLTELWQEMPQDSFWNIFNLEGAEKGAISKNVMIAFDIEDTLMIKQMEPLLSQFSKILQAFVFRRPHYKTGQHMTKPSLSELQHLMGEAELVFIGVTFELQCLSGKTARLAFFLPETIALNLQLAIF